MTQHQYNGGSIKMADLNETLNGAETNENGATTYLTPEGYKSLHEELEYLTLFKRPEIADRIRESQEHGEFSEDNSELDEVKFEQAIVEGRIVELKTIFGTAQLLDLDIVPTSHVGIGSVVKLKDEEFGETFEVRLVSSIEADPSRDLISIESPMGVALIGAKPKEKVQVQAPDGPKSYSILAIGK